MSGEYCISEECRAELLNIYKDYFLEDEESFIHTINEFMNFYDKLPPERIIKIKYRQFLSALLNKSKSLVTRITDTGDYQSILVNLPLYKHLHSLIVEYDADLREIITFEDLFINFNKYHKFYDALDELYNKNPEVSIRVKFVDFTNKVLKFYAHNGTAYTEESLPRFEQYLKSKLALEV